MDPIASLAEDTLLRSAHPALRLSELLESVAERMDRTLDGRRLRSILEAHPERFKILEPWGLALDDSPGDDAWVVAISEPRVPPDGAGPVAVALRESVRWLARGIDPRSRMDVSRWYAIALSERAIRASVVDRAA